jgi:hypothetical protein
MQCACAILLSVDCPAQQNFPRYLIYGMVFEIKLLNIKCVFRFSLQILMEAFFIPRRTERDMIKNIYLSVCKVSFIFVRY